MCGETEPRNRGKWHLLKRLSTGNWVTNCSRDGNETTELSNVTCKACLKVVILTKEAKK